MFLDWRRPITACATKLGSANLAGVRIESAVGLLRRLFYAACDGVQVKILFVLVTSASS